MRMNKRGGEKILSMWWFLCLALVAGAIVAGTAIFYSLDVDTRTVESGILIERLSDCMNNQGTIDVQYFNKSVDIFSRCDLDKLLFATGSDFFFKFELYMDGKSVLNRSEGRAEIEKDCELTKLSKNYPRCVNNSEEVLVLYPELRKAELKVLVGSNQFGGRLTPANNGA